MKIKEIAFVILLLLLVACEEEGVFYHKQVEVENHIWRSSDPASFDFNINDTSSKYDLFFLLRTTDAYPWSNIYIFTELNNPDFQLPIKDTVEFYLADKYGNWKGENSGSTIEHNNLLLYKAIKFPIPGHYTFTVHQAMIDTSLIEIMDVGLKIVESK